MPRRNAVNRIPRGGFSVRAGGRTVTMKDIERAGKLARRISKTAKSKGLLKTVKGLAVKGVKAGAAAAVGALADKAWESVKKELDQRLDSKTNGRTLVDAPNDVTGPSAPIAAASVTNTTSKMVLANSSDDRKVHKTSYQTGYPLTSAMKRLLKQNGGTYEVLDDSKINMRTVEERNILTQSNGFNTKRFHVPPVRSQVPWAQVRGLCFGDTYNDFPNVYADVLKMSAVAKIKQQFMIKNQSVALPLDMTIHLVKVTDYSIQNELDSNLQNFSDYFARCFQSPTALPGAVEGRIPLYYMTGFTEFGSIADGTRAFSADVLNQTKLNYSGIFKQGFEVVESFRKVLAPGDFWNFSHTHVTGNGIDMKQISRQVSTPEVVTVASTQINSIPLKNSYPFTYGVVFESKGKMGEIYYCPLVNNLDTYLGTTPAVWAYEYKTSAYYVTNPNLLSSSIARVPWVMETVTQSALPGNTGEGALPIKPFNLGFDKIAFTQFLESDVANEGKGYVPMTTSANPTAKIYEGSSPG